MQIGILCDGNDKIGAGHFYRCVAVGNELLKMSFEVTYYLADRALVHFAQKIGVDYTVIDGIFEQSIKDFSELFDALDRKHTDVVIIDSHRASKDLLLFFKGCYFTVYFDDLLSFPYDVDMIINSHIDVNTELYWDLYKEADNQLPTLLLGVQYFTIRDSLIKHNTKLAKNTDAIAFLAGGSDPEHITLNFVSYLYENAISIDYELLVVVGPINNDYDAIRNTTLKLPFIKICYDPTDMRKIYESCSIAISAAGITLYELAYYGIPTVSYSVADNQLHTSRAFDEMGLSINVGDVRFQDGIIERMLKSVENLRIEEKKRKTMAKKASSLIDGYGAYRIATQICKGGIKNEVLQEMCDA